MIIIILFLAKSLTMTQEQLFKKIWKSITSKKEEADVLTDEREVFPIDLIDTYLKGSPSFIRLECYPVISNAMELYRLREEGVLFKAQVKLISGLHKDQMSAIVERLLTEQDAIKSSDFTSFTKELKAKVYKAVEGAQSQHALGTLTQYFAENYSSIVAEFNELQTLFDQHQSSRIQAEEGSAQGSLQNHALTRNLLEIPGRIMWEQAFLSDDYWNKRMLEVKQLYAIFDYIRRNDIDEALALAEKAQDPQQKGIKKLHWIQYNYGLLRSNYRLGVRDNKTFFERRQTIISEFVNFLAFDLTPPQSESSSHTDQG